MGNNKTTTTIRLYLVDDHALFREGLIRLLSSEGSLELVGAAASPQEALDPLLKGDVDVLMLDYDLKGHSPVEFVLTLKASGFQGKILLVTAGLPDRDALELIRLGVSGIFHKQHATDDLIRSVWEVYEGKVLIEQNYLQTLMQAAVAENDVRPTKLTERERKIMRYLLEGLANKEIAAQLAVSETAVKASLQQLFAKTGVRTRSQLVRIALEQYRDDI